MLFTKKCCFTDHLPDNIRNFAKDPAVVRFKDRYLLYFSTCDEDSRDMFRIGIATGTDMENWDFVGLIPLEGACEEHGIAAPAAFLRDGVVHLFYQTYGNREKDAICHAYSSDGINFTRNATNPVFSPSTDWCCGRAIDADIVAFKDKIFLYFATRDHAFKIQKVGVAYTSPDSGFSRSSWIQGKAAPCLEPKSDWEKQCIEAPAAVVSAGKVYMFYGGAYNCEPQQIGVAVSDNGIDFTRLSDLPLITNGAPGEWNSDESGHPYIFENEDSSLHLFYQGSSNKGHDWYLSRCRISITEDTVICD